MTDVIDTAVDLRPVPTPTPESRPFWDGCREHRLLVLRCDECGNYKSPPPDPACPRCGSMSQTWVPSSGRGVVDSFTVVHRPAQPSFPTPYVVAVVGVEEGWYLPTTIVGIAPEDVTFGMAVRVRFAPRADGFAVPEFEPVPCG